MRIFCDLFRPLDLAGSWHMQTTQINDKQVKLKLMLSHCLNFCLTERVWPTSAEQIAGFLYPRALLSDPQPQTNDYRFPLGTLIGRHMSAAIRLQFRAPATFWRQRVLAECLLKIPAVCICKFNERLRGFVSGTSAPPGHSTWSCCIMILSSPKEFSI